MGQKEKGVEILKIVEVLPSFVTNLEQIRQDSTMVK